MHNKHGGLNPSHIFKNDQWRLSLVFANKNLFLRQDDMNTNIQLLKISVLLEINVTASRRSIPVWGDNVSSADDTMEIYSPNHWHESSWEKKLVNMVILNTQS